ncbi:hypothetical protein AXG93_3109s1030 [Marchantia polymorpha subsp. ruderalis]|uniref:Uncharacterized protein n=1 Tax=Marchantia polymorpha subsp. ruderalis TaxID=1480154 RepID=A0A176VSV0_MARPO|nr:hypothetical protein AXG93_3109s1030 [Marchantia polymorpha subsp. ruderalis]
MPNTPIGAALASANREPTRGGSSDPIYCIGQLKCGPSGNKEGRSLVHSNGVRRKGRERKGWDGPGTGPRTRSEGSPESGHLSRQSFVVLCRPDSWAGLVSRASVRRSPTPVHGRKGERNARVWPRLGRALLPGRTGLGWAGFDLDLWPAAIQPANHPSRHRSRYADVGVQCGSSLFDCHVAPSRRQLPATISRSCPRVGSLRYPPLQSSKRGIRSVENRNSTVTYCILRLATFPAPPARDRNRAPEVLPPGDREATLSTKRRLSREHDRAGDRGRAALAPSLDVDGWLIRIADARFRFSPQCVPFVSGHERVSSRLVFGSEARLGRAASVDGQCWLLVSWPLFLSCEGYPQDEDEDEERGMEK